MTTQTPPTIQGFEFTELCPGLVICEAPSDNPHSWNNATADQPAFLVYLGYNIAQERVEWISQLRSIWKIKTDITDRSSQRVSGYWHEIKIRGMQRYSDPDVFDLDYLSESKQYGLDSLVALWQMELEASAYEDLIDSRLLTLK
jgi:hypothetical protein